MWIGRIVLTGIILLAFAFLMVASAVCIAGAMTVEKYREAKDWLSEINARRTKVEARDGGLADDLKPPTNRGGW